MLSCTRKVSPNRSTSVSLHSFVCHFKADKDVSAAKERHEIELAAQRATLQEQRNHIGILDTALTNAQQNIRQLEEELQKKQMYIDRLNQIFSALKQSKQKDYKNFLDFESDLKKESHHNDSSMDNNLKWQL